MKTRTPAQLFGVLAISLTALAAHGQATVSFANFGATWAAPWYSLASVDPSNNCALFGANSTYVTSGNTLLAGTGYTAELWAGPDGGWEWETQPLARTTFRTAANAGLIGVVSQFPIVIAVPGQRIIYQMRVWDNQGGSVHNWDEAINVNSARGATPVYLSAPLVAGPNTLECRDSFVLVADFAAPSPVLAMSRDGCKRYTGFESGIPIPSVNAGENVTLSVVCPNPATSVQWSLGGVVIPGATAATLTRSNIQVAHGGLYTAVVTATLGTRTARMTNSIQLNVLPAPWLDQAQILPTRAFSLKVEGVTDRMVQIEYSADLRSWSLGPTQMIYYAWDCGCMMNSVTIPPPLPPSARFYRVRLLP